ncbi:hypothetical protein PTTG_06749 [Puccinia triticina 1-1 BBBD Race 1]|uniref:CSC1/OSCA1-like 7TM region domain-containing protein n=2 Tax=Puccinia triticina TaxID=208348 RepID=A0A180GMV6_PUCT1|nr:uncharacterized protein PtA15_2A1 [Puccinia triticina]OAV94050.1 hypothetical protein PTTG_06749 [Puccinia triticina 1-1 BBBD Race 1]WAQ81690.1 hypothetical protein PtA15_2A1 [Puccinia triticina]WAR52577.1 hypothetical protein PtB15_2B1 [Puccinia triticina]
MSSTDTAAGSAASGLLSQYQAKLTQVSTSSVLIQLVLMFLCSLGTLLAFSILRPKNKIVYMPRYKYSAEDKRPPKLEDGLFAWLKPLAKATEDELLAQIGLDAVVFLRFLRMCRWMCSLLAMLACAILIPCDVIYNLKIMDKSQFLSTSSNTLAMVSISNVRGSFLYVHVVYGYLVTFIVLYVIYVNYKTVVRLRWQWFRSPEYQNAIYARSIMMTHVGSKHMSDPGLQTLLSQLQIPYPTTAVHIGRRVGMLAFLIERHNQTVRDLEQVLVTYLKGGKISASRPTTRIGKSFLGFGGRKVDAIDFYTAKIKQYELRIQAARDAISARKPENYGFASFAAVAYAHVVAKKLGAKRIKGVAFSLAPPPQDIIWENLTKSDIVVFRQRVIGEAFMTVIATLYVIPLVALALLANLASLTQYVGFLNSWSIASPETFSAFAGIAPPLLSTLLQLALPVIMRALARFQAATTHQKLDRAVFSRYFAFLTATQFLIFSLLGVVFSTVAEVVVEVGKKESFARILQNFNKLPDKIQSTYLQQSNYWLTWFPLRGFTSVLDLVQIVSLLLVFIRTKVWGRTPREIREWTKPPEFDYSVYSANVLLMLLVAFVYAPLAPLVPLLASAAFFASSWIYKYQLMYISITRCESGGRLWRMLINRVLFALCAMHAFLCLTIGLQLGWFKSIATLPPFAVVIAFKFFLKTTFDSKFTWYIPTGPEFSQAHKHNADARKNRLMKRFGHPSLHAELFTPMIHKDHQSLLSEVYRGRIGDPGEEAKNAGAQPNFGQVNYAGGSDDKQSVPGGPQPVAGGLRFAAIAQHDLMYSQQQFLRERGDDEMSLASTSLGNLGHARENSNAQVLQKELNIQGYLENGPRPSFHYQERGGNGSRAASPAPHEYPPEFASTVGLPYHLPNDSYGPSPVPTHNESLEFDGFHPGIPTSRHSTYGTSQSRSTSPLITNRRPPA